MVWEGPWGTVVEWCVFVTMHERSWNDFFLFLDRMVMVYTDLWMYSISSMAFVLHPYSGVLLFGGWDSCMKTAEHISGFDKACLGLGP